MATNLGGMPVATPKYRHTLWDNTTNKDFGRPEEPIRMGKWWFIPGNYNRIEDVDGTEYSISNLSRFSGDSTDSYALDNSFIPNPNGRTYGLTRNVAGTKLYVTGAFTSIAGQTRNRLAVFNPTTGALLTDFNGLASNDTIRAAAIDNNGSLWVAGEFTSIGGATRTRLAKFNESTFALQSMDVVCSQTVLDLVWDAVNSRMLVLLQNDGTIGGGATCKLAALSNTGVVAWRANPNVGAPSFQVDCDTSQAYVATGSDNETYAYSLTSGAQQFVYGTDGNNQGLKCYQGSIFIGHHGDFCDSGPNGAGTNSQTSKGILAVDPNGVLDPWRPQFLQNGSDPYGGGVLKVFRMGSDAVNGQLCVTGDFTRVVSKDGSQQMNQRRVALFIDGGGGTGPPPPPPPPPGGSGGDGNLEQLPADLAGPFATFWNGTSEKSGGRPSIMLSAGGWIYVGGHFDRVLTVAGGTVTRHHMYRADKVTGELDADWNPACAPTGQDGGRVWDACLSRDGTKIFVVGDFTTFLGQARDGVAVIDAVSGALETPFSGLVQNGSIRACSVGSDGSLYLSGSFTTFAGVARQRAVKIQSPLQSDWTVNTGWSVTCDKTLEHVRVGIMAGGGDRVFLNPDADPGVINGNTCNISAQNATNGQTVWFDNYESMPTVDFAIDDELQLVAMGTAGHSTNVLDLGDDNGVVYNYTGSFGGNPSTPRFVFHCSGDVQGVTFYKGGKTEPWIYWGFHDDEIMDVPNDESGIDGSAGTWPIANQDGAWVTDKDGNLMDAPWRSKFQKDPANANAGVLKVWGAGRDESAVDPVLFYWGDFTRVQGNPDTDTKLAMRVAMFREGESSEPPPPPPPTAGGIKVIAAGDFGVGSGGLSRVADLVDTFHGDAVTAGLIGLGDIAYQSGTLAEFNSNFDPELGGYTKLNGRDFFWPVPGSHDYGTWGASNATVAGMTGYESYLRTAEGLAIGPAGLYYSSQDIVGPAGELTNWVLVRVNGVLARSGFAQTDANGANDGLIVPLEPGSVQYQSLSNTFAAIAAAGKCALVGVGHPRFTSPTPNHTLEPRIQPLFTLLDQHLPGRAIVMAGHQHNYERFFPQTATGTRDDTEGNVAFVVGTGGISGYVRSSAGPNSAAYQAGANGVLELTLFDDSADFRWVRVAGESSTFTDSGTIPMNVSPPPPPPPPPGGSDARAAALGASGTTVSAPKPASVVTGEKLVASVSVVGADTLVNVPSGWTLVDTDKVGSGASTRISHWIYEKTATSTEPSAYVWVAASVAKSIYVQTAALATGYTIDSVTFAKSSGTSSMDIDAAGPQAPGVLADDQVLVMAAADFGPRPWADQGCLLGFMPNETTGDPVSASGIARVEGIIQRQVAAGHSMYPAGPAVDMAPPGTFPEAAGANTGVTSDWEDGRMSFISWPRQEAWLNATGQQPTRDSTIDFQEIIDGQHDDKIVEWLLQLKAFGQPMWFRPFWEMNGGDPPWSIGYVTSAQASAWSTAFKAAWRRIYILARGTQGQVDALDPGMTENGGNAVEALNLFFSWNPQEFESSPNTSFSRDSHWPGDTYSEAAATELYVNRGETGSQKMTNTGGGGFGGITHLPLYSTYAGAKGKLLATGEGGPRWLEDASDTDALTVTRINSLLTMFKNFDAHKIWCYWDGGQTAANGGMGQSALQGLPSTVLAALRTLFNDPWMNPELTETFEHPAPATGFDVLSTSRVPTGRAKTNYGVNQLGGMVIGAKPSAGPVLDTPALPGYGFGRFVTATVVLTTDQVTPVPNVPTITGFTPTHGPVGTQVTVTGTKFLFPLEVEGVGVGGVLATFTILSDTSLRFNVPPGAGTGPISVSNTDGTATTGGSFFTVDGPPQSNPPVVTSIAPTVGPIGTQVSIVGSGFTGVQTVRFGLVQASFTVVSDTQITTIVPPTAVTSFVIVSNAVGAATNNPLFTIPTIGVSTEFYWRVRVRDASGNVSEWSDAQHVRVVPPAALVIGSPTQVVEETRPTITTTLVGRAQASISYVLEQWFPPLVAQGGNPASDDWAGGYAEVWRQRRIAAPVSSGGSYSFRVPKLDTTGKSPITKKNTDYRLTVRAWDTQDDRVAVPSHPVYSESQVVFQWQPSSTPAVPQNITATDTGGAGVDLQWTRSAVPNAWTLLVDDEVVADEVDALDWQVSGTLYGVRYFGAEGYQEHTYEVAAVVTSGGVARATRNNPTATLRHEPLGIWLVDREFGTTASPALAVQMYGDPESPGTIAEASTWLRAIGRRAPIRIVDSIGGYEDAVSAAFLQSQADLEAFEWMAGQVSARMRFAMSTLNIPARISDVSINRMNNQPEFAVVGFKVTQDGEFAIPQRKT